MSGSFSTSLRNQEESDYKSMHYEIHEDNDKNVFVKDLALIPVTTVEEVMAVINMGLQLRATHETKINEVSSRSHTVFTINVIQRDVATGSSLKGMLNLVDLAGSERLKKSESSGQRLKEALHINTSLTALGKVVLALDPSSNSGTHVPYRDSKVTRLLQNSLGGNSYTTLVATIHPVAEYAEESLSTLMFANRCRNVQNTPSVNYAAAAKKSGGAGGGGGGGAEGMSEEITLLKKKLKHSESSASLVANPNERVLDVLKQLGITAVPMLDGTLQLPDGRIIGAPVVMPGVDGAGDNTASTATLGMGMGVNEQEYDQVSPSFHADPRAFTLSSLFLCSHARVSDDVRR